MGRFLYFITNYFVFFLLCLQKLCIFVANYTPNTHFDAKRKENIRNYATRYAAS